MKRTPLLSAALIVALLAGCAVPTLGERATYGDTTLTNPPPVMLNIQDKDKQGTASGVGPARYTSIRDGDIQTMQTGTVPRDVFVKRNADGSFTVSLSTGSDVLAKGVKYNPATGQFSADELSTLTSEPLKAHAAAFDVLAKRWNARDRASQETILGVVKAVAPDFETALRAALAAGGVP